MELTPCGIKRQPSPPPKKVSLLLLFLLSCSLLSFGQTVRLSLQNAPLEDVFQLIEAQTRYRFVYVREELKEARPVTLTVSGRYLEPILALVFAGQPLSYSINNKYITVYWNVPPKESASRAGFSIAIRGRVLGEGGEPLPGASVMVKESRLATTTDGEGRFNLPAVPPGSVLVVSSIGYQTTQTEVGGRTDINIRLPLSVGTLEETVVIAYGTTTRRLNTGSISKVAAAEIGRQPGSNPLSALQGRVPGLVISQRSGVPGAAFNVELRGRSVLDPSLSRNDPLIIIDGVPFEPGSVPTGQLTSAANIRASGSQGGLSALNTLNPGDMESIEVLKDADATAIYGSRGANGVILITTKKGEAGKTRLTLNTYTGWSTPTRIQPLLNTEQYLQMRREGFANEGQLLDTNNAPDLLLWDTTRYTDFKKLLLGETARSHSLQAALSGGSPRTGYRVSGHYRRETTVFSSDLGNEIGGARLHGRHRSEDRRLEVQLGGSFTWDKNNLVLSDPTRYLYLPPHLKLYEGDGSPAWSEGGIAFSRISNSFTNPLAELLKKYFSRITNLLVSGVLSYRVLPDLTAKVSTGYNRFVSDESSFTPSTSIDPFMGALPSASFARAEQGSWIIEPQLHWERAHKQNKLSVLVGTTFQHKGQSSTAIHATNYTSDLLLNSPQSAGNVSVRRDEAQYRYSAQFGRVHGEWKGTYLLNLTGRRDGSSRFSPEARFAFFGAAGGAWIFSKESWFKPMRFFSFGKLRASYGLTGNDQIGDYRFLNLWTATAQPYGGTAGLYPSSLYNPAYSWEKTRKGEAALELGFWGDRLQLSTAYYRHRSSNQLVAYTLPAQTGFFSVVQNLAALVQNSGWEVSLVAAPSTGEGLRWKGALNLTIPRNKLVSFPGLAASPYGEVYVEGYSLNTITKLRFLGVDPATGLYTFEDVDKDGRWNERDYQVLGHTDPKFYGGLTSTLTYKGLSFSFLAEFRKQRGLNYLSQLAGTVPGTLYNQPSGVMERWRSPGEASNVQRFSSHPSGLAYTHGAYLQLSDGIYSDASYVRIKNAELAYALPARWLSKVPLHCGRVYVQALNALTLTPYEGGDPETQNVFVLPPLKTVAAGLQLTF